MDEKISLSVPYYACRPCLNPMYCLKMSLYLSLIRQTAAGNHFSVPCMVVGAGTGAKTEEIRLGSSASMTILLFMPTRSFSLCTNIFLSSCGM